MRKFYLKLVAFLLISLVLIQSPAYATADTRLFSHDVQGIGCYTATTVGGMTCYQDTVDANVTFPTGASAAQVQGTAADGAAAVGSPVQIGGKDGSGNVQSILTGTDGTVKVDGSAVTQPVSGTITAVTAITNALPAGTNLIGNVGHGKTIKTVTGTVSADTDIVAAVASKRIKVVYVKLTGVSATVNTITFQSNASTALDTTILQSSAGITNGVVSSIPAPSFLFATVAGEKLTLDVSAAQNVTYTVSYFDDDAT